MGDILGAIQDDINEYEALCRKYGEKVLTNTNRWGVTSPDCYGKHADALQARKRKEMLDGTWKSWNPDNK